MGALLLWLTAGAPALAEHDGQPVHLSVVGSLGGVRLFEQFEKPFWREQLPRLSGGTAQADIVASDTSGIRGQDMLHMVRLGVVPFGTVLLGLAANDEPELDAPNLALLAPDIGALRRMVQAYRPHLDTVLRQHYGAELLAVFAYPAQVLFCTEPLSGLDALRGRRVRVSQSSQADFVEALGGQAMRTPYGGLRAEIAAGRADCAITGSSTGNDIGLHQLTRQVYGMPVSWGLSVFVANTQAWTALPEPLRVSLRRGLAVLEQDIWAAAARDTEDGFLCNAGHEGCRRGTQGNLRWERPTAADEMMRRRLLAEAVVPGWIARCGEECRDAWNTYLAPMTRVFVPTADAVQARMGVAETLLVDAGLMEAGSQASTGALPASMMAPASSSMSSR